MGVQITLTDGTSRNLIEYNEFSNVVLDQLLDLNIQQMVKEEVEAQIENGSGVAKPDITIYLFEGTDLNLLEPAEGKEFTHGDFVIWQTVIKATEPKEYSRTAYIYNVDHWEALNGNYTANNIYFNEDITYTENIGTYKVPTGKKYGIIPAENKSISQVLSDIFASEVHSVSKSPKLAVSASAYTETDFKEIGEYITKITFTGTYSDGTYSQGTVTNVDGDNYSASTNAGCKKSNEQTTCNIAGLDTIDSISGEWLLSTEEIPVVADSLQLADLWNEASLVGSGSGDSTGSTAYVMPICQFQEETTLNITIANLNLPEIAAATDKYIQADPNQVTGFTAESISIFSTTEEIVDSIDVYSNCIACGATSSVFSSGISLSWHWHSRIDESETEIDPSESKTIQLTGKYFWISINEDNMGFNDSPKKDYDLQIAFTTQVQNKPIQITSTNNTKYAQISSSCDYSDATKLPATNLEKYDSTCTQITGSTLTKDTDVKVTGNRKIFWGYKLISEALETPQNITATQIRGLQQFGKEVPSNYIVPENTKQVFFAVPSGTKSELAIKNANAQNAPVACSYFKSHVNVPGANNYTAIEYDLWVTNLDKAFSGEADLVLAWK